MSSSPVINFSFLLCFLLIPGTLFFPTITSSIDTITPGEPLLDNGTTLISAGENFELGFFGSKNKRYVGIWYHKIPVQTIVWVANRQRPITSGFGNLSITTNGTLFIADGNSTIILSPPSSPPLTNSVAQLLDNGNFVLRESSSQINNEPRSSFAWQSFDFPTDTLIPGMKLGWNLKSRFNRNLTEWTSSSDPAPSDNVVAIDFHNHELFLQSGTTKVWRSGPWNGLQFSGIPEMKTGDWFTNTIFVANEDEVFFSYTPDASSIYTRLVVNQSVTQRLVWIEQSNIWNVFWSVPKDQCDNMAKCGPNGVCNPNNVAICDCLPGFRPSSPTSWSLGDWTDGCQRKTALDCRNRTDGFVPVRQTKLPDTSNTVVDTGMSLEQCAALCLKNCSCTAYAAANISGGGDGIGCIRWATSNLTDIRAYTDGGQDLYLRLAAADLSSESNDYFLYQKKKTYIIVIVVVLLASILLASAAWYVWKRKKRSTKAFHEEEDEGKDLDLPIFDLATIIDATNNFSTDNKLGQGGFGPVYRGILGQEKEIAVKRLSKTSAQGIDELKNEVRLIAKLQHRNLVRLLGCCIQGEESMLIYEYMPNRSLDAILFDKARPALLDWQTRYNIIVGIARGLLYLHEDSRFRIIHRDLKASNILLDKDMNPKISDFGMARIFGGDQTEANTRRVVGTYGYMSPEYVMDGVFSMKSDVFSFGVLVLEIISGKRNREVYDSTGKLSLLGYAWSLFKEGKHLELVDELIGYPFPIVEVIKCIKIGLLCVQELPKDRPTMSSILLMLGGEGDNLLEPREPGFIAIRGSIETESTKHEVTLTIFEGR
ncbi:receptor-like serine/threonine-protein kinase SD1-8 isoform X6 [Canna indica]|uniref:Receptor-like serine/threonine-protein kinase n=1 Tax=Canna indica TaxID=4628 RepID=A0AAQ3K1N6_9LILI|nr:receptor-like serine/threonine-protein kinase SD1-8 isoform X6 [Canna indica]